MSVMQRLWIISLHLLLPVLHGDGGQTESTTTTSEAQTTSTSAGSSVCAAGWTLIGTRCFHYSGEERTYDDSVSYCEGMGSVIASIRGESENADVTALIPFACGRTAYIGAETKGNEVWSWHDGTGWWQPHNNGGLLGVEDTRVVIKGNDRLWYDWGNGSALHGVLCAASFESPAVPIADNNVSTFCSNGWTRVGDRCFLYDGQTRGFGNSVKFCEGLYSRIASFHSEEENRIATALIPGRWAAWIGAQGDGHGVWSWRDGTPWWQPAVTADIDGLMDETYIVINSDKLWHDWSLGGLHGVLCASPVHSEVGRNTTNECGDSSDDTASAVSHALLMSVTQAVLVSITCLLF
mmetsp:Transcript_31004/g.73962  ORF Transcript_31004/g.73962 Transcript_31004/m.73962 type:complete len:351 (+) Transcript_31004:98-1150(+)